MSSLGEEKLSYRLSTMTKNDKSIPKKLEDLFEKIKSEVILLHGQRKPYEPRGSNMVFRGAGVRVRGLLSIRRFSWEISI